MRLGWRNPRPNDFNSSDERPLKDVLSNIQQFMTWPHFTAVIDGGQAGGPGYAQRTITATDDPYSLIRAAVDDIIVPYDFDRWMFVGRAHVSVPAAGAGLYQVGFNLNGVDFSHLIEDAYSAGAIPQRAGVSVMVPVSKGQALHVKTSTPGAVNIAEGYVAGFFLPMT